MAALAPMDVEKRLDLSQDEVERPGLVAAAGFDRIAVHRVAGPDHRLAFALHGADEARQMLADLVGAEAADQREPARLVLRAEEVDQLEKLVRREARPAFYADRVLDAAQIIHMRMIEPARAVARPQEMARGRVPVAGRGIDARQRLLVAEQQRLMARVEARRAKLRRVVGRKPDGAHEAQGLADVVGELLIAMAGRTVRHEAEHPLMHVLQIGVAALREGAQQVQRGGRLAIGHMHALRVRRPGRFGEIDAVDDVAAIARQLDTVLRLGGRGARLGELAGDAADLHHRKAAGIGQHDRHLEEHAEEVADLVRAVLGEALRAVAALEQEGLPLRDAGELGLKLPRLACKNERREAGKLLLDLGELRRVRIGRDLLDRLVAPAVGAPTRCHYFQTPLIVLAI